MQYVPIPPKNAKNFAVLRLVLFSNRGTPDIMNRHNQIQQSCECEHGLYFAVINSLLFAVKIPIPKPSKPIAQELIGLYRTKVLCSLKFIIRFVIIRREHYRRKFGKPLFFLSLDSFSGILQCFAGPDQPFSHNIFCAFRLIAYD